MTLGNSVKMKTRCVAVSSKVKTFHFGEKLVKTYIEKKK